MSDIFREVEEEVRREQYRKLWDRYGFYAVTVAVLAILAVSGVTLYRSWMTGKAEVAAAAFERASVAATGRNPEIAIDGFRALRSDAPAGYAALAGVRLAASLVDAGQPDEAVALYDELSRTITDPSLKAAIAIKLAWIVADLEPEAQIRARLEPFMGDENPWRHAARELMAYQAWRFGRYEEAKGAFEALATDPAAPRGVTDRAKRMIDVITTRMDAPDAVIPPPPSAPLDETPDAPAEPELTPLPTP